MGQDFAYVGRILCCTEFECESSTIHKEHFCNPTDIFLFLAAHFVYSGVIEMLSIEPKPLNY